MRGSERVPTGQGPTDRAGRVVPPSRGSTPGRIVDRGRVLTSGRALALLCGAGLVASLSVPGQSGATSLAPRSQHAAVTSAARSSSTATTGSLATSGWRTFHGDPGLSGVSSDPTISSANAGTLGLRWMYPTGAPVDSSPVIGYDDALHASIAFIGNTAGNLDAVDIANGSLLWSRDFGVPILATPTVYDGSLWVGTFVSGHVYKLDATTGATECAISLGTGTDLSSPTIATPPGQPTSVYFGVQDNGVVSAPIEAVNESTCAVEWSVLPYAMESGSWNPTSFGVDATGQPLVLAGSANPDSTAYALNALTGATVWQNRNLHPAYDDVGAGITVSPPGYDGIADGMAYYPGEDGILYAIDLTTGKTVWTFNFLAATTPSVYKGGRSAAALVGNELVFGTGTGVMAVNAVNGTEIWDSAKTVGPDTEIISSPLVTGPAGGQVVVYGDMDGNVKVLSLATGAQLYDFQTHGYIMSSPADIDGQLLIGSSDGFLYDLGLGGANSSTYPSTSITSPANGAVLANPNSATSSSAQLTVTGTAAGTGSGGSVLVGIQQDGGTGPWWDAASASWVPDPMLNPVSLSASGAWSIAAPVPRAGAVWGVSARAEASDGYVDPIAATSAFTIDPVYEGPRLHLSVAAAGPGAQVDVSGAGFAGGVVLTVALGQSDLTTVTTDSSGAFGPLSVHVPPRYPYGLSAVTAVDASSGQGAAAALMVTSPWTEAGQNPARTGFLAGDTVLSSEEVPDKIYRMSPILTYATSAPISGSAVVADGVAYVGNSAGALVAVDVDTGAAIWTAQVGGSIAGSPLLDLKEQLVVVGSTDGTVAAFHLATGEEAWSYAAPGAVATSPALVGTDVYLGADVGSTGGELLVLDAASGSLAWTAPMDGTVLSSPAIDVHKGIVVLASTTGEVAAFSTGAPHAQLWAVTAPGPVDATPVIGNGVVFVGAGGSSSSAGTELALAESSGAAEWSAALGGSPAATSALVAGRLMVGTSSGTLLAFDPATGTVDWAQPTAGPVTGVAGTVGLVFIESSTGTVSGFRTGGENVWLAETQATLSGTPTISDNAVLVGAGDGGLWIYTPYGLPMN